MYAMVSPDSVQREVADNSRRARVNLWGSYLGGTAGANGWLFGTAIAGRDGRLFTITLVVTLILTYLGVARTMRLPRPYWRYPALLMAGVLSYQWIAVYTLWTPQLSATVARHSSGKLWTAPELAALLTGILAPLIVIGLLVDWRANRQGRKPVTSAES